MTKTKQTAITPRDPADFGLASFLDLLPTRTPLIGQAWASARPAADHGPAVHGVREPHRQ